MAMAQDKRLRTRLTRGLLGLALAAACVGAVAEGSRQAAVSDIVGVRFGGDDAETRIVVDLRRSVKGEVLPEGGAGLSVTLDGAAVIGGLGGQGRGLVRTWRMESGSGGAKLTLTLARAARVERRFLIPPADGVANYRYVLDIAGSQAPAIAAVPKTEPVPPLAQVTAPAPHGRKVIVLDPGHGGKDPGAAGAESYEKNVTLAAARVLKARLERDGRYRVVMTRDSDTFVPLEGRVQIARRAGADLFISLHADSGPDPATHGASIYTLSERGASRVGSVLNQDDWFLQEAQDSDDQAVGQILLDLTQRSTRNRSAVFAQQLLDHIGDRAPLLARTRRDAGYFVLLAPDVPATLLEMGFITNPKDEARLNDAADRAALMNRVADAIDAYFAGQTKLAAR
jgi:N-acetylmuramoyl-L-alanine amidase